MKKNNQKTFGHDAGFFDEPTTWQAIAAADKLARGQFTSWTDFAHSYVLGRAGWGGATPELQQVIKINNYLLLDADSPWQKFAWPA